MERKGIYVLQERSNSRLNIRKPVSVKQRNTKQLMEKKRRARINSCLETLKSLVLKNTNQDISQFSKLEKADVLEMVVKYMENVQKPKSPRSATNNENQCTRLGSDNVQCMSPIQKKPHLKMSSDRRKSPKRRRLLMDLKNLPETSDHDENSNPFSFSDSDQENTVFKSVFSCGMSEKFSNEIKVTKVLHSGERITQQRNRSIHGHQRNSNLRHAWKRGTDESLSFNSEKDGNSNDSSGQTSAKSDIINQSFSDYDMDIDNSNVNENLPQYGERLHVIPADATGPIWRPW